MKKVVLIPLIFLLMFTITTPSAQPQRTTMGHSEWIAKSLKTIQTIEIGMTRWDLLKLFSVEGGASNRTTRTYIFRERPYIKVDVGFEPVGSPPGQVKRASRRSDH
jgi:hypothetical protein